MSLMYNCWFAGQSPDLHQLLDQLVDEHLEEVPEAVTEEKYFYFYESNGAFHLYYNEDNEHDKPEDRKPLLSIYPSSRSGEYTLAFGDFQVRSSWFLEFNKWNIPKADEAFARLLRSVLRQYEGNFVSLFNGEQVILYRVDGRIYLNPLGVLTEKPLLALLDLKEYELRTYEIV